MTFLLLFFVSLPVTSCINVTYYKRCKCAFDLLWKLDLFLCFGLKLDFKKYEATVFLCVCLERLNTLHIHMYVSAESLEEKDVLLIIKHS